MTRSRLISRRTALRVVAGTAALPLMDGLPGMMSPALAQQAPPESEKAKQIVALVEKAAALIDGKGTSVFPEFRRMDSEWRSGDTYLFVDDMAGMAVFNAARPDREAIDIRDAKDSNGKLFVAEFKRMVQSKGSGWVDYMWPKPGQSQPSQKWTYVKAVTIDGRPGYVAAGFYP